MESMREIFEGFVEILTTASYQGVLADKEKQRFIKLLTVYEMYYGNSYWGEME